MTKTSLGTTLNANEYLIQKKVIKAWIDARPDFKYKEEVGLIALSTHLHIVLVSYFIGYLYGFSDEIKDKMKRDMKFYTIDRVIEIE